MSWAVPLMIAAAMASRSPDERQALADLAYLLGEAHALRQACEGVTDQTWRGQMSRMVEVEAPDEALRRRLVDAFNTGFANREADHPGCDEATAEAARDVAERGRALAERLGGVAP